MNKRKSFPLLELVACVGRPFDGDWEYVLWVPSIDLSWTVNKNRKGWIWLTP
jgi:hypothetical protein